MKISYNWLKELIPEIPGPEQLSAILTSVGLEVENIEKFEEIKGNFAGLVVGKIVTIENHPAADKLKITEVDINNGNLLQIVCGAKNIDTGQKVIVAPAGSTIFPSNGEPVLIKKTIIRGIESEGMICAEDEIGLGNDHAGIIVLPDNIVTGSTATNYFNPSADWIFEIGLTPNRIDAMSHTGVAKDVCAYLSHHTKKNITILSPSTNEFKTDNNSLPVQVVIENTRSCERYAGVSIANIKVQPSPKWLQVKLKSVGVRPVNNIVDITNFILHETGQPLHAYDLQALPGNRIVVKNLPEGTLFVTLDAKERKLYADDLMICNGLDEPLCFGGVFGGLRSGVKDSTTQVFLESAWFNPAVIRRTSLRQNLRTDAAIRFEKGVDISETVKTLMKASMMIKELAGGEIASAITDWYPRPKHPILITLQNEYLRKIAGKNYARNDVKSILQSLGFGIENEDAASLTVSVPFSKPDVTLPVDIIEEIIRIDGFDNIEIPSAITITPALEANILETSYKETISGYLMAAGFSEIFTNSITNSKYYDEAILANSVKILNSLSTDLDIMRPSLMETGLECIIYNLNRKNNDLRFFEFGNTYTLGDEGNYHQEEHLCLFISGNRGEFSWKSKSSAADFYFLKGLCQNIFDLCLLKDVLYEISKSNALESCVTASVNNVVIAEIGTVNKSALQKFDIKQPVLFADLKWKNILLASASTTIYKEIPKFPSVHRDLSLVVHKNTAYAQIEKVLKELHIQKLENVKLFDVFESEKLGPDKKAFAISLTFIDVEKTLTDKETDASMNKIILAFKQELNAEIRK